MRLLGPTFVLAITVLAARGGSHELDNHQCMRMCGVIESCSQRLQRPDLGHLLCHVAACEIGGLCGRKEVRSPNGLYHGPFQFGRPTWNKVCRPFFKRQAIAACSAPKAIYDTCCTSLCATQIVAQDLNGGLHNWPHCGPQAQREIASETAKAE